MLDCALTKNGGPSVTCWVQPIGRSVAARFSTVSRMHGAMSSSTTFERNAERQAACMTSASVGLNPMTTRGFAMGREPGARSSSEGPPRYRDRDCVP